MAIREFVTICEMVVVDNEFSEIVGDVEKGEEKGNWRVFASGWVVGGIFCTSDVSCVNGKV